MLSDEVRRQVAQSLHQAEIDRKVIPKPSQTHAGLDIDDAYAIQRLWAQMKLAAGARLVGHKIGLTSRAMQISSQIDEPDYGHLFEDGLFNDGAVIQADRFTRPRIEVELAFVLGAPLKGPGVRIHDVIRATEYVTPALEIIDCRTETPRLITDTIADNAAFGGLILGGRVIRPFDVDIRWIGATLARNGVIEESGVSAAVMGHPAAGVAWLANKLAAQGVTLEAGHILLGGSFTRPVEIAAGDVIQADYGPLGAIGVSFV